MFLLDGQNLNVQQIIWTGHLVIKSDLWFH